MTAILACLGDPVPVADRAEAAPRRMPSRAAFRVADAARAALVAELEAWPKPGLVSPVDNGSHDDMDAGTLARSAEALHPFFAELYDAGARGAGMAELRAIGLRGEGAMAAATLGANTHRGAVFALGLIAAAEGNADAGGRIPRPAEARARAVGFLWGADILAPPPSPVSHGGRVATRYGAGGARAEAAMGFPSVRQFGLPALRLGRRTAAGDERAARVACLFALLARVDDTNLLHRGGLDGLRFAQAAAARFEAAGGVAAPDWQARAMGIHRAFVARRLSPGGCADLLAATLFLDALERAP